MAGDLVSWFRNLILKWLGGNASPVHIEQARLAQADLDKEIAAAHEGASRIRQMFRDHMAQSAKRLREHADRAAKTLESADLSFTYGNNNQP